MEQYWRVFMSALPRGYMPEARTLYGEMVAAGKVTEDQSFGQWSDRAKEYYIKRLTEDMGLTYITVEDVTKAVTYARMQATKYVFGNDPYWGQFLKSLPIEYKGAVEKSLLSYAFLHADFYPEGKRLADVEAHLIAELYEHFDDKIPMQLIDQVLSVSHDEVVKSAGNYYARTNEVEKANSSLSPRMNSFSSLNKYEQLSEERRQVMELVRVMQKHAESHDLSDYSAKGAVQEYLKSLWADLESGLSYEDLIKEWSGNAEA